MSLRLRQLDLRVQTGEGLFGTSLKFENGLVLLRADNSMGKSTCIQAIVYALGLERMLGPSSSIPLPHVMTRYVEEGSREIQALESEVLLEVENQAGDRLTIQRSIIGQRDPRLVSTWDAPRLTNPTSRGNQSDYFVRDPGAAQSEAGFFQKLTGFLGWELPTVRRFNGTECPLYLETIFPLFIVEQKHGWSGIQANLPTYFGIRDMAKRTVEFVLNLDAARLGEERQEIEQEESNLRNRWKNLIQLIASTARLVNGRVTGLPEQPSAQWPLSVVPAFQVYRGQNWIAADNAMATDKSELAALEAAPVETVGTISTAAEEQLNAARQKLAERETIAAQLLQDLQREEYQQNATASRLASLEDDLRRNKDAQKLRTFGSNAGWSIVEHTCPTCQQKIADTLLPQVAPENPMSIEENISFIQNQLRTFQHLKENSVALIARKQSELASFRAEITELHAQIRALRQTLIAPNSSPSIEGVRQLVDLESRIRVLERAILEFHQHLESFGEVATAWRSLLDRKKNLPADGFSGRDKVKLDRLQQLFRQQLREFGFDSLNPDSLDISRETYRPTREGFDLGFDLSASDNIRTIWAYLQALLELAHEQPMHHPGLLIFDEPRQQEAEELSFANLLKRAAGSYQRGQQILFATSEPLANIEAMTAGLPRQIISYDGRVITKQS